MQLSEETEQRPIEDKDAKNRHERHLESHIPQHQRIANQHDDRRNGKGIQRALSAMNDGQEAINREHRGRTNHRGRETHQDGISPNGRQRDNLKGCVPSSAANEECSQEVDDAHMKT